MDFQKPPLLWRTLAALGLRIAPCSGNQFEKVTHQWRVIHRDATNAGRPGLRNLSHWEYARCAWCGALGDRAVVPIAGEFPFTVMTESDVRYARRSHGLPTDA